MAGEARDPAHTRVYSAGDVAWDEWLDEVPRDVYHLAGYHAWARDRGEGEPYLVVVGTRRKGLAWPYLVRPIAEVAGLEHATATDVTSVYGYPGPLVWGCLPGDPFIGQAWSEVVSVWRTQGAVTAFTRFHPLLGNAVLLHGLARPPADRETPEPIVRAGCTVSIECTLSDEDARAEYARPLRQHIAAARRAGYATTHDEGWMELAVFADLYRDTMARNRAGKYYYISLSDFERLRDALAGHVHLLVTRTAGAVGAAGIFTELSGIVQAHFMASSMESRPLSPGKVLLDDARTWARQRGNSVLHLGGGRGCREDSLLAFKGEFSQRRHDFCIGRWVLDAVAYRDLVEVRERGLDDGQTLDPNFFPRYRAPANLASDASTAGPVS